MGVETDRQTDRDRHTETETDRHRERVCEIKLSASVLKQKYETSVLKQDPNTEKIQKNAIY